MAVNTITATVRVPGLHHWPDATASRAYLAAPHRHLFVVRPTVVVEHEDRAVEYHNLAATTLRILEALAEPYGPDRTMLDFGPRSCEAIATGVADALAELGLRVVEASVSEDDEFTATHRPEEA